MDGGRLRRDLTDSLVLPATGERRLFGGAVLALCGYGLWVGATGAALSFGADVLGRPVSVAPWTGTTTVVVGLAAVLWVLGPAAAATYLLVGALTNVSGNIAQHYRVQYPSVLVGPPLAAFGLVGAAVVGLGVVSGPVLAVLVVVGAFVLVRTLAYSYRVFSLSVPHLVWAFVFLSACVLAVTVLASVASLAGRGGFVANAAAGIGDLLGVPTVDDIVTGTTQVGGVAVPTLPGLAATVPVVFSVAYVAVQMVTGLVARLRGVTVPRSQLRTGQRYPVFARPTTGRAGGSESPAGATGATETGNSAGASGTAAATGEPTESTGRTDSTAGMSTEGASTTGTENERSVSHTKVFTPPDDADGFDAAVPDDADAGVPDDADTTAADGADAGVDVPAGAAGNAGGASTDAVDSDTAVTSSEPGYRCPSCEEMFAEGADFAYCPTCGAELQ